MRSVMILQTVRDWELAYNTLTTISVSPVNNQIIYTGSDDGNVHVTIDGGITWQNISEGFPKRWITRVAADPLDRKCRLCNHFRIPLG